MRARTSSRGLRPLAEVFSALLTCAVLAALAVPAAQADFAIDEFKASTSKQGLLSRQAGDHPDLTVGLTIKGLESLRNVRVDLPPGLVGNPTALDKCTTLQLVGGPGRNTACPTTAQVGTVDVVLGRTFPNYGRYPLWNMLPPGELPALFALNIDGSVVFFEPSVNPRTYAISTTVTDTTMAVNVAGAFLNFWAVPADSSHDSEREFGAISSVRKSFMTNPTSCPAEATPFTAEANTWQTPSYLPAGFNSDPDGIPFRWEGCDRLPFAPSLQTDQGSQATAGPTGVAVEVNVPQSYEPGRLSTAHVRKTVVALPKGFTISASAAAGIGGCTEAQFGLGTNRAPTCPGSSALGTVKLKTPLLDEELDGELYFATQKANPFGSLIAIYMAIKGPGFYIKLPGKTDMDQQTGQVTTTFDDIPQLPFERMRLIFRGGAKAPLVAPQQCGIYNTQIDMTSWASPIPVHLESPMRISENCDTGGFDPKLHAGSTNPVAGANTPFNVQITRNDGEQTVSRIETTLPPGLVAKLAGSPLCGDSAAATGRCPANSQIGTITLGAGSGPSPLYLPEAGKDPTHIYFGGPYRGAPYSMLFVVPAQAGPFDLGTVVVRAAVYLDPTTAQVTIKSDPIPQILEGVPVQLRDMRIEITKPTFTLNPTNCTPSKFESTITSDEGKVVKPTARFQVSDCASLAFKPKLTLALKGGTKRAQYPALRAVLKQGPNQANIAKAATTLPHSEFLANEHIQTICTRVQYAAHNCPEKAIYGKATAYSPLIDQPITGPVYLRSSNHELPDLVADLGGEIDIDLVGRVDSVNESIRTTFETVPDAPVSKFVLEMQGGKKGLLVNSTNICKGTHRAKVLIDAHNGKTADQRPKVKAQCAKSARKGAKKKSR